MTDRLRTGEPGEPVSGKSIRPACFFRYERSARHGDITRYRLPHAREVHQVHQVHHRFTTRQSLYSCGFRSIW